MTYGSNSDKCPVCRSKQQDYMKHNKLDSELEYKWVKCPEPGCALRCPLRDFLQHSHGKHKSVITYVRYETLMLGFVGGCLI